AISFCTAGLGVAGLASDNLVPSFEGVREHPGSKAQATNETKAARKTGERVRLARRVRRLAEHLMPVHRIAASWKSSRRCSVGETPTEATETVALPIRDCIAASVISPNLIAIGIPERLPAPCPDLLRHGHRLCVVDATIARFLK